MLAWRAWIAMKVREPFWMAIQAVKKNTQAKVSTKKTSVPANKRKTVTNIDAPSASMLEFGNYFEGKYVSLLCLKGKKTPQILEGENQKCTNTRQRKTLAD